MAITSACGPLMIWLSGSKAAGRAALVDAGDYDRVLGRTWWVMEQRNSLGTLISGPYAQTQIQLNKQRQTIYMHTLITGWPRVDHRNGNGLDNTRKNLREATKAQNGQNRGPAAGHSAFKGVGWDRRTGRWYAQIKANGTRYWLGRFTDELAAAHAYDIAAQKLHGAFAWLNFPEVGNGYH